MKRIRNTHDVLQRKFEMLSYIPKFFLIDLARKYGIPSSIKISELREKLAEKASIEEIEEIYEKFEDAGNVTIYLFKFDKENVEGLSDPKTLFGFLKNRGMENVFKKKRHLKLTSEPQIVFVDVINSKIKVKLEAKGDPIIRRDAESRRIISFSPLITSTAFIHTDSGLVEVRIRNRRYARKICEKLSEIFNGGKDCNQIKFDEKELEEIIKWAETLRNATIKPLSGAISSLRITAAQGSDLRNEEKYKEIEKIIGESIRTGVYIQYVHEFGENKILKVGFQINSQEGKIFFKTRVNEEVVDYVLSKIKEIKGL